MIGWSPDGWKSKPALQQVAYDDPAALASAVAALSAKPPLVTPREVDRLRALVADAQDGRRFFLQGGDCAETLSAESAGEVAGKLGILAEMSRVLEAGGGKPVIRVGRFAGQYAKPRSSPIERRGSVELPSYFGDLVNRPDFTPEGRRADPRRLVAAYEHATRTMGVVRSLSPGDAGDLFSSHEALHLWYESAQLHRAPGSGAWYLLSTHLPWVGERTRDRAGAHIELVRGIANPVGIKLGPRATADEVLALCEVLDPGNAAGKLVLISRMGAGCVAETLPAIVRAVNDARRRVLWVCDPMHGNTVTTATGAKTRDFAEILRELELTFDVHDRAGTVLGGVHFELTGEDVTECTGGDAGITEADLERNYATRCDPRLNYRQSLEMASRIARRLTRAPARRSGVQ